ncbi:MAG: hypothetical protein WA918_05325 [Erythrobacter sp.]
MTCVVLLAATLHQTASADAHWLKLHTVTVDKPRERSGDRPYFIAIEFRSRLGVAGSTRIQVREDEPHDWSGKRHYRNGLTTQRDHLFAGEAAPIPFWMGEFEWANVNVTQPSGPLSVAGSEFIGLILVAVDNNNLPPHVMQDFVNMAGDVSRRLLVEQIEQNGLVASREGSRAFVRGDTDTLGRLLGRDGTRVSVPLAPGREIAPRTVFRAEVNAPPGFRYCDIGSFELAFSTRKSNSLENYDDWDMHGINLHAGSSMVFCRTPSGGGAKVHRFSHRDRVWRPNLGIPSC